MEIVQSDLPFPIGDLKRKEKPVVQRFSKKKRDVVTKLFTDGFYLMESKRRKRSGYVLYKGNMEPVTWYSKTFLDWISHLLKTDKKKRHTFNRSLVRQEHGKTLVKQLYKQIKSNNETS